MVNIQAPRLKLDAAMETGNASPVPALGNTLANFLAARLSGSFGNLNCQNFGLTNPVTLTVDGNGVATAATFNTAAQTAKVTGTTRGACAVRCWRRRAQPRQLHDGQARARVARVIHGAGA